MRYTRANVAQGTPRDVHPYRSRHEQNVGAAFPTLRAANEQRIGEYLDALRRLEPGSLTHFDAEIIVGGKRVPATPARTAAAKLVR